MTVVFALVPLPRPSVLHAAPLRLAVFDCSTLGVDLITATYWSSLCCCNFGRPLSVTT